MKKISFMQKLVIGVSVTLLLFAGEVFAKSHKGVTLTLLTVGHPSTEALKEIIPDFEKETGMKVLVDEMDYGRVYDKEKMEMMSSVSAYDVIQCDCGWIPEYAAKKLILPLEPFFNDPEIADPNYDLDDVFTTKFVSVYDKVLVGLPMHSETDFLFYRKDLFKKYGKEPPKTMKEFMETAKFFNKREPGLYGVVMRGLRGEEICFAWSMLLFNFGGKWIDENKQSVINSPEALEALEFYVELMKYAPLGQPSFGYDKASGAFMHGDTAMFLDATNISYMENPNYSRISGKIGWVLPPKYDDKPVKTDCCSWVLAIPANCRHKKEAFKFIQWATNKKNVKRQALSTGVSPRESVFEDPELVKKYPYYPLMLEAEKRAEPNFIPRVSEYADMWEYAGLALNQALIGVKTPKEALDWAQKKIAPMLTHYLK